jgi:hypothetical protein
MESYTAWFSQHVKIWDSISVENCSGLSERCDRFGQNPRPHMCADFDAPLFTDVCISQQQTCDIVGEFPHSPLCLLQNFQQVGEFGWSRKPKLGALYLSKLFCILKIFDPPSSRVILLASTCTAGVAVAAQIYTGSQTAPGSTPIHPASKRSSSGCSFVVGPVGLAIINTHMVVGAPRSYLTPRALTLVPLHRTVH